MMNYVRCIVLLCRRRRTGRKGRAGGCVKPGALARGAQHPSYKSPLKQRIMGEVGIQFERGTAQRAGRRV